MVGPVPPMPMNSAMSRGVHSLSGSIFENMSTMVWPALVLTWLSGTSGSNWDMSRPVQPL